MKGYVSISLDGESFLDEKMSAGIGREVQTFSLDINIENNEKLIDILSDSKGMQNSIKDLKFYLRMEPNEEYELIIKELEKRMNTTGTFFDTNDTFYIDGNNEQIREFLKNNPELKDKDIVLSEFAELNIESLNELKKYYGDYPNVRFFVIGNTEPITIKELELTIHAIDEIVNKIKQYDYSPFEALMYAYDLIRDRFYVKEDKEDKAMVSRDLTSVLLGNKIVCLGFANIFDIIAKKLGINSLVFKLELSGESGHARNLIYLKDEKYCLDGLYFFDPTWDCKKDDKNNFLYSYKYFAKTAAQMDEYTGYTFVPTTYKYFDLSDAVDVGMKLPTGVLDVRQLVAFTSKTRINSILHLLGKETIDIGSRDYTGEELFDLLEEVSNLAANPIMAEDFVKALYTVRRNQYYENPNKYLFDMDTLTNILVNSKVVVEDSPEERLLALLGIRKVVGVDTARDKIEKYMKDNNLDKDIETVKIVRLLRTHLENKLKEEKQDIRKLEKKM